MSEKYKVFRSEPVSFDLSTDDGQKAAIVWLRSGTVEGMLQQIELPAIGILEEFGLPTDDHVALILHAPNEQTKRFIEFGGVSGMWDRHLYREDWPEHVKLSANVLFRVRECRAAIAKGSLQDAVFNAIIMMSRWCDLRLHQYEPLIWMGIQQKAGGRRGGQLSGLQRTESSRELHEMIRLQAKNLNENGYAQRNIASAVAKRLGCSSRIVRKVLKEQSVGNDLKDLSTILCQRFRVMTGLSLQTQWQSGS